MWPWARVGGRTRSTAWRRAASPCLQGMKNPTGGSTAVLLNSIYAQAPQTFIFRNWEVETTGNPLAHAVLRGYVGPTGQRIQLPLRVP